VRLEDEDADIEGNYNDTARQKSTDSRLSSLELVTWPQRPQVTSWPSRG
jgi:hypothetical protein